MFQPTNQIEFTTIESLQVNAAMSLEFSDFLRPTYSVTCGWASDLLHHHLEYLEWLKPQKSWDVYRYLYCIIYVH